MANQVTYSRNSIIDLSIDSIKVSYGTVERNGSSLSLVGRARCGFEYTFNTTGDTIRADQLQLQVNVASSNNNGSTRYNSNIAVLIQVQYWEEVIDSAGTITDYVDGTYDVFKIFPYLVSESDGYNNTYNFSINSTYIKSIYIEFMNLNEEDKVTFSDVNLLYSITVSQAVAETVGFDTSWSVVLNKVEAYQDGCKLYFEGAAEPTKLQWLCDEHQVFNGVKVNDEKIITFSKINSPLN